MLVLNALATEPCAVCSRSFLAVAIESLHIGHAHAAPANAATTITTSSTEQANFQRDITVSSLPRRYIRITSPAPPSLPPAARLSARPQVYGTRPPPTT